MTRQGPAPQAVGLEADEALQQELSDRAGERMHVEHGHDGPEGENDEQHGKARKPQPVEEEPEEGEEEGSPGESILHELGFVQSARITRPRIAREVQGIGGHGDVSSSPVR
jgi:hypothetical protein